MKITNFTKTATVVATVFWGNCAALYAQAKGGDNLSSSFLNELEGSVEDAIDPIVNISTMVIGFAAIITLAYCVFRYFKGDQQSSDLFIKVGGGAFIVAILMFVIRQVYLN